MFQRPLTASPHPLLAIDDEHAFRALVVSAAITVILVTQGTEGALARDPRRFDLDLEDPIGRLHRYHLGEDQAAAGVDIYYLACCLHDVVRLHIEGGSPTELPLKTRQTIANALLMFEPWHVMARSGCMVYSAVVEHDDRNWTDKLERFLRQYTKA